MTGKFVLVKDDAGAFRFTLQSPDGSVLVTSEGYAAKGAAQNGIDAVRKISAEAVVDDQTPRS